MERAQIERNLAATAEHIRTGEKRISEQQIRIHQLEERGKDATEAYRLLNALQEMHIMRLADRDRLLMALAKVATEERLDAL